MLLGMARPLRVNLCGGWYHVMHRGIERRAIFETGRDHEHFLELLGEVSERYRFVIHAYCLLGNHYHSIIETPDGNLSQGLQWLGLAYSSGFNARHQRAGPLFQGRFCSVPVEGAAWAYELSLYIHLNPVRTFAFGLDKQRNRAESQGLGPPPTAEQVSTRLKKLCSYPWSSYRAYAGYTRGPKWLQTTEILRRASRKVADRIDRYRTDVRQRLQRGVDPTRLEQFRNVLAIGSAQFIDQVKTLAELGREMGTMNDAGRDMDYAAVSTGLRWFDVDHYSATVGQCGIGNRDPACPACSALRASPSHYRGN